MGVGTEKAVMAELYQQQWNYMIEKNIDGLGKLLSDTFVLMHMTGVRQSKEDFLHSIKDGTLNYYSAVHEEIRVNLKGDTTDLLGRSIVNAAVYGGGRRTWHLQGDYALKKINGKWMFTESKVSIY